MDDVAPPGQVACALFGERGRGEAHFFDGGFAGKGGDCYEEENEAPNKEACAEAEDAAYDDVEYFGEGDLELAREEDEREPLEDSEDGAGDGEHCERGAEVRAGGGGDEIGDDWAEEQAEIDSDCEVEEEHPGFVKAHFDGKIRQCDSNQYAEPE